jgi:hypothetical protein
VGSTPTPVTIYCLVLHTLLAFALLVAGQRRVARLVLLSGPCGPQLELLDDASNVS